MGRLRREDRIFKALRRITGAAARSGSGAYKGGLLARQCGPFLTFRRVPQGPLSLVAGNPAFANAGEKAVRRLENAGP